MAPTFSIMEQMVINRKNFTTELHGVSRLRTEGREKSELNKNSVLLCVLPSVLSRGFYSYSLYLFILSQAFS